MKSSTGFVFVQKHKYYQLNPSFIEAIILAKSYKSCDSGGSQEIKGRSDADSVEKNCLIVRLLMSSWIFSNGMMMIMNVNLLVFFKICSFRVKYLN
jgi:hypothetical protein